MKSLFCNAICEQKLIVLFSLAHQAGASYKITGARVDNVAWLTAELVK
ncbi:hypothetical protein VRC02_00565 [Erwinia sp. E_sp_B01_3]